jgi:hypothetical protein
VEVRRHSTRAEKQIPSEALRLFLKDTGSPLAEFSDQILASPHWSTIIGICWIEQYHCTHGPNFNLWGIGPHHRYSSYEESINAISDLLSKYEIRGKDTLEELNGYYVQPASNNWLSTVLRIKSEVESL